MASQASEATNCISAIQECELDKVGTVDVGINERSIRISYSGEGEIWIKIAAKIGTEVLCMSGYTEYRTNQLKISNKGTGKVKMAMNKIGLHMRYNGVGEAEFLYSDSSNHRNAEFTISGNGTFSLPHISEANVLRVQKSRTEKRSTTGDNVISSQEDDGETFDPDSRTMIQEEVCSSKKLRVNDQGSPATYEQNHNDKITRIGLSRPCSTLSSHVSSAGVKIVEGGSDLTKVSDAIDRDSNGCDSSTPTRTLSNVSDVTTHVSESSQEHLSYDGVGENHQGSDSTLASRIPIFDDEEECVETALPSRPMRQAAIKTNIILKQWASTISNSEESNETEVDQNSEESYADTSELDNSSTTPKDDDANDQEEPDWNLDNIDNSPQDELYDEMFLNEKVESDTGSRGIGSSSEGLCSECSSSAYRGVGDVLPVFEYAPFKDISACKKPSIALGKSVLRRFLSLDEDHNVTTDDYNKVIEQCRGNMVDRFPDSRQKIIGYQVVQGVGDNGFCVRERKLCTYLHHDSVMNDLRMCQYCWVINPAVKFSGKFVLCDKCGRHERFIVYSIRERRAECIKFHLASSTINVVDTSIDETRRYQRAFGRNLSCKARRMLKENDIQLAKLSLKVFDNMADATAYHNALSTSYMLLALLTARCECLMTTMFISKRPVLVHAMLQKEGLVLKSNPIQHSTKNLPIFLKYPTDLLQNSGCYIYEKASKECTDESRYIGVKRQKNAVAISGSSLKHFEDHHNKNLEHKKIYDLNIAEDSSSEMKLQTTLGAEATVQLAFLLSTLTGIDDTKVINYNLSIADMLKIGIHHLQTIIEIEYGVRIGLVSTSDSR